MSKSPKQKLYCYVDETGQDARARLFVVVAVVTSGDQERFRRGLMEIERHAGTGSRKWHKSRPARRLEYLRQVLDQSLGSHHIFFGSYPKPLPFFFPMLDVLERAILTEANAPYTARVYVDGIDRKKAAELTNALRLRGISLEMVRSRRDESEPLIRLADMWAGCIRAAQEGNQAEGDLFAQALRKEYLRAIKEKTP